MSRALSKIFDTTPNTTTLPAVVVEDSANAEADIAEVRANLKQLMATATEALQNALEVAIDSESPRAYEVVTGMISAAADLNSRLVATHQVEQKMKIDNGTATKPTNVTNNNSVVFTGTPAELSKLLKGQSQ